MTGTLVLVYAILCVAFVIGVVLFAAWVSDHPAHTVCKELPPRTETPMVTQLREHLDSITSEEFDKEIEEIENLHGDGVTILDDPHIYDERDFIGEAERSRAIDFAKWLAQDWMSIWVGDKWMWECQTDNVHLGYKTEEELYELYLKSV